MSLQLLRIINSGYEFLAVEIVSSQRIRDSTIKSDTATSSNGDFNEVRKIYLVLRAYKHLFRWKLLVSESHFFFQLSNSFLNGDCKSPAVTPVAADIAGFSAARSGVNLSCVPPVNRNRRQKD